MRVGATVIILGAVIITASFTKQQFMAGRFVLGFGTHGPGSTPPPLHIFTVTLTCAVNIYTGISIATSAAPTYGLEISPPQWRARVVGFYNSFFYTGEYGFF